MISSTFGAPWAARCVEPVGLEPRRALDLAPNLKGGAGICSPLMVVVAPGEPGTPVTCWASTGAAAKHTKGPTPGPHPPRV